MYKNKQEDFSESGNVYSVMMLPSEVKENESVETSNL